MEKAQPSWSLQTQNALQFAVPGSAPIADVPILPKPPDARGQKSSARPITRVCALSRMRRNIGMRLKDSCRGTGLFCVLSLDCLSYDVWLTSHTSTLEAGYSECRSPPSSRQQNRFFARKPLDLDFRQHGSFVWPYPHVDAEVLPLGHYCFHRRAHEAERIPMPEFFLVQ